MKISPTLTEVKEIAKTGKYDILPVSCEILSDFITPIEAMRILREMPLLKNLQPWLRNILKWILYREVQRVSWNGFNLQTSISLSILTILNG